MTREQLIEAMDEGLDIRWCNDGYICKRDNLGQYLLIYPSNGYTVGVFHSDGVGMNLNPNECYIVS